MSNTALKALILMLAEGFPSSASQINDSTVEAYLIALKGVELADVRTACGRFIRGEVERFSHAKLPSAPELVIEVRQAAAVRIAEERLRNQLFVIENSPLWQVLVEKRGRSLPATTKSDGTTGWYVDKEKIAAVEHLLEPGSSPLLLPTT